MISSEDNKAIVNSEMDKFSFCNLCSTQEQFVLKN